VRLESNRQDPLGTAHADDEPIARRSAALHPEQQAAVAPDDPTSNSTAAACLQIATRCLAPRADRSAAAATPTQGHDRLRARVRDSWKMDPLPASTHGASPPASCVPPPLRADIARPAPFLRQATRPHRSRALATHPALGAARWRSVRV